MRATSGACRSSRCRSSAPEAEAVTDLEPLISRLAEERGFSLPSRVVSQLAIHLEMALRWSKAISLTAVRDPEEAVRRHVLESLQAARHLNPPAGGIVDVGSGNGYPALPAKCLQPILPLTLLEPALRKSVFLESAVRAMGLESVEVRRERVDRPADLERYTGVGNITMRGVGAMEPVLAGGAKVLPPGGRIILVTSRRRVEALSRQVPRGLAPVADEAVLPHRDVRILVLERFESPAASGS